MFPRDFRRERRSQRPRLRPENRVAVEGLETRQLMAYSPFGFSLPQLSVSGFAGPTASYNSPLVVDVVVENQGASSLVEPTNLAPGSISSADAAATTVQVFASPRPNATSGLLLLDTISIPIVRQNSDFETISEIALPSRPRGFPGVGGKLYLTLVVNNDQAILQTSNQSNIFRIPTPVRITNPLPDLQVVALDILPSLQPGDVITPTVQIVNLGPANPALQGPVLVELVASLDKKFGPGDAVIGSYLIPSLPGTSEVPTRGRLGLDVNLIPPANVNTTTLPPIRLPTSPGFYYLGVVIDPFHTINQTYAPSPALRVPTPVGPRSQFLPPSALLFTTNGSTVTFPNLPSTLINPLPTVSVTPPVLFPNPSPVFPVFPSTNPIVKATSAHTRTAHPGRGHG